MASWFLQQSSQALGILCLAGVISALFRWKSASRRDFLLAFTIYLAGSAFRECVVYYSGSTGWGDASVLASGAARVIQIVGVTLFIRAAVRNACPPWTVLAFGAAVLILVAIA